MLSLSFIESALHRDAKQRTAESDLVSNVQEVSPSTDFTDPAFSEAKAAPDSLRGLLRSAATPQPRAGKNAQAGLLRARERHSKPRPEIF
jgi:hypothetical protein